MGASLIIHRPSNIIYFVRRYRISVNGVEYGRVENGGTLRVEVPDGEIVVQATMSYYLRSAPVTLSVTEGETVELDLVPKYGYLKTTFVANQAMANNTELPDLLVFRAGTNVIRN